MAEFPGLPAPRFFHDARPDPADFRLSLDAAQLSPTEFDGVCLMSCDADMAPAVERLRETGLTVHVFGRAQTAGALQRAADRFHLIEFPTRAIRPVARTAA